MSKYTTEVRFICETKSGFTEEELKVKSVDEIIDASKGYIFNFDFPIYDESHRGVLENKILKHYYTREISAETVGLWQLWLNSRLNDIMPKYNNLYRLEHLTLNKELKNIDVETVSNKEEDYTRTDNLHEASDYTRTDNLSHVNTHNDLDKRKYSDTPQGSVTFANVDNEWWLTDYTENQNNGGYTDLNTGTQRNAGSKDNTGTQRNAGVTDDVVNEVGYRGGKTYAELMSEYSKKIINIDLMIIKELKDLFFNLW